MILLPLEDRRGRALEAIREHPERSDRRLAAETGLSREMIVRLRGVLAARGEVPAVESAIGLDGRTYRTGRRERADLTLCARLASLSKLARSIGDPAWDRATPSARRMFLNWAERLARAAAKRIDADRIPRTTRGEPR